MKTHCKLQLSKTGGRPRQNGFTLVEVLVVISIIILLVVLGTSSYRSTMKKVEMTNTMTNMRQLAAGTIAYASDHNGYIPRGDEGTDGGGLGGRGIIWINHIAPNIGFSDLETKPLNKNVNGMDQWTYLMTSYKQAPFVCRGFNKDEMKKAQAKTPDAIGGIGYNIKPLSSATAGGPTNASWGSVSAPIALSRITHQDQRCMYASSYDWHLVGAGTHAYNRFGRNKAVMVFWDGSSRVVSKTEFLRAINSPETR